MKKYVNFLCVLILALLVIDFVADMFLSSDTRPSVCDTIVLGEGGTLVFQALLAFAILGILILSIVYFVKFILNINRDEVFTLKNVILLRKYGACLLLATVLDLVLAVSVQIPFGDALAGDTEDMVAGATALLIAEVFGIGLKLQEGKNAAA